MPERKSPNFAIFIQTVFANFYPKFGPRLRLTQFLSEFQIRPLALSLPSVIVYYVYMSTCQRGLNNFDRPKQSDSESVSNSFKLTTKS